MVAAAFLANFVVFGVIYSFGVFLKPMAAEFHTSAAAASAFFIFALATGLLGFVAIASLGRNGQPERGSAADAA
jgi:hypothetical protein